uniref:Uncharacterized protein n=1 Tax=Myotis myotis TaxID=51298 RepID=A0A7J7Y0H9_MYOMY|nr:hypothetical protein mMyoMyo1_011475 [Myotis myotis]
MPQRPSGWEPAAAAQTAEVVKRPPTTFLPVHNPALTFSRNRPFDRRALRPPSRRMLGNAVHPRGPNRQDSANQLQGPACITQLRACGLREEAEREEEHAPYRPSGREWETCAQNHRRKLGK